MNPLSPNIALWILAGYAYSITWHPPVEEAPGYYRAALNFELQPPAQFADASTPLDAAMILANKVPLTVTPP